MKEIALQKALMVETPLERVNILREYLQAYALRSLHESGAFQSLSFVGGTALRFLYELPRFSEDLDFSLERPEGYKPAVWLGKMKRDFNAAGFSTMVSWNDRKTVHVAWLRVAELLNEVGVAGLSEQKLSIKLEIDTRPPRGAVLENDAVNRYIMFALRHHNKPSLMAGKVHALLTRGYPKGRDWYDLVWYLSQRPSVSPNIDLLNEALVQTEGTNAPHVAEWKALVLKRFRSLDLKMIRNDVEPFLEHPADISLIAEEHLEGLLLRPPMPH